MFEILLTTKNFCNFVKQKAAQKSSKLIKQFCFCILALTSYMN